MKEILNFSNIGHSYLKYANPLAESKIDFAIDLVSECAPKRILDIGAGNLYVLKKFLSRFNSKGVAVELPGKCPPFQDGRIELKEVDANIYINSFSGEKFDVAICMASTHALGGYKQCLKELKKLVRPGGMIIIGEGYWKKEPDPEYITNLGGSKNQLMSHCENLQFIENLEMTPLWATTASLDEWDHYEWFYSKGVEDFVHKNPKHPQSNEFQLKIKNWRNLVWRWGRDTMGFGLYVIRI